VKGKKSAKHAGKNTKQNQVENEKASPVFLGESLLFFWMSNQFLVGSLDDPKPSIQS